jgi:hypothetical protein
MSDDLSGEYALSKYRYIDVVDGDPATTLAQVTQGSRSQPEPVAP